MENRAAVFPVDVDVNEAQARRRAVTAPVGFRGLRLPKCRALRAKALGTDLDRGTGTSMGPAQPFLSPRKYHLRTVNLITMPSHQRAVACRKRW
jgi:hypothetical protein